MTLKAIVRSIIHETGDATVLAEQYIVELVDHSLPCPYLGGTAGVRIIEDTDVDSDGEVKHSSWSYNLIQDFTVTPKGAAPIYKRVLNDLNGHAVSIWNTEKPGALYDSLKQYFISQNAPFQVEGVEYPMRSDKDVLLFRQMLNRKFGASMQSNIEKKLAITLAENERPNVFAQSINNAPPSYPTPKVEPYNDWATFS